MAEENLSSISGDDSSKVRMPMPSFIHREGWEAVSIYQVPQSDARNFGHNQENRKVDARHIARIKKDWIKSKDFMPPITINQITNNIIDGQHRLQAFIELVDEGKLPSDSKILVRFINVEPSKEKQIIIDSNTKSKNWKQSDYIDSYSESKEAYKNLIEWCSNHPLCIDKKGKIKPRYGAAMIKGKGCGGMLKNGKFTVTDDELKNAEATYNELLQIIEILGLEQQGSYIENLAVEWAKAQKNYELVSKKNWLSLLTSEKNTIAKMPKTSGKAWRTIFDNLFNKFWAKNGKKIMKESKVVDENGKEVKD